jgi:hypothetical protein
VLPTISDTLVGAATKWSVLDLSCETPAGMTLANHVLSAGDLRLRFRDGKANRDVLVRQIRPASLALQRQPIEKWLDQHPLSNADRYVLIDESNGNQFSRLFRRRRSFRLGRRPPEAMFVRGWHAERRDRLVIVESSEECLLDTIAATVGWAHEEA